MDKEKIGDYLVSDQLYEGQIAVTYKATHSSTGNVRALRLRKFHIPADKADIRRILRIEATVFSELYNNQIIRTYDSGFHKDQFYTVTDLISGEALAQRLQRENVLTAELVFKIALNVTQAISYAHELGIIHSSITPDSVLIREGFADAVVTDFRRRILLERPELKKILTEQPTLKWQDHYAPESLINREYNTSTDIYQIGMLLHDCIYGVSSALSQTKEERKDLPPAFIKTVLGCIDTEPNNRPLSAERLHLDFEELYKEFKARKEKGQDFYEETTAEPEPEPPAQEAAAAAAAEQATEPASAEAQPVVNVLPEKGTQPAALPQNFETVPQERKQDEAPVATPVEGDVVPKVQIWEPKAAGQEEAKPAAAEQTPEPEAKPAEVAPAATPQPENTPAPTAEAAPPDTTLPRETTALPPEQAAPPAQETKPETEEEQVREKPKIEIQQEELSTLEAQEKAELAKLHALENVKKKRQGMASGDRLFRDGLIGIFLISCYMVYHLFGDTLGIHLFTKYKEPVTYNLVMLTPPLPHEEGAVAIDSATVSAATIAAAATITSEADEARIKAEAEAKAKAEAEAKAKAEAEAEAKAKEDAEAKAKTDAEAKAKASAEAKAKTEAEAKAKTPPATPAAAAAKPKSDLELMREMEARRKAEIERRIAEQKKQAGGN